MAPKFPPGPSSIPVLGSLPFLSGKDTEKFVSDYISSFGSVTGLMVGQYYVTMIKDWKVIGRFNFLKLKSNLLEA